MSAAAGGVSIPKSSPTVTYENRQNRYLRKIFLRKIHNRKKMKIITQHGLKNEMQLEKKRMISLPVQWKLDQTRHNL